MAKSNKAHDGALFGRRQALSGQAAVDYLGSLDAASFPPRHRIDKPSDAIAYVEILSTRIMQSVSAWERSPQYDTATDETKCDAADLKFAAKQMMTFAKHPPRNPAGTKRLRPACTFEWIEETLALFFRWRARCAGAERAVGTCRVRDEGLAQRRRPKIEIDREDLRAEWGRARQMRPHADKESLRRVLAERLGKSPSTIKRRLREHGIDPPEKKTDK